MRQRGIGPVGESIRQKGIGPVGESIRQRGIGPVGESIRQKGIGPIMKSIRQRGIGPVGKGMRQRRNRAAAALAAGAAAAVLWLSLGEGSTMSGKEGLQGYVVSSLPGEPVSGKEASDPGLVAWWGTLYPEFCYSQAPAGAKRKISFWLAKALDW